MQYRVLVRCDGKLFSRTVKQPEDAQARAADFRSSGLFEDIRIEQRTVTFTPWERIDA